MSRPSRIWTHFSALQPFKGRRPEFASALLALMVCVVAWLFVSYQNQVAWAQRTLLVETKIADVLASVQGAETNNRGFLLTGDDVYLTAFTKQKTAVEQNVIELEKFVADNAEQTRMLRQLKGTIEARLARLDEGIEQRRSGGIQAAAKFVQSGQGRELMERVRAEIRQMDSAEQDLLKQRLDEARRYRWLGTLAAGAALALIIFAMTGWVASARREERERLAFDAERATSEAQIRQMQKVEAIGQLTGGIAHDFNNMLAVIISGLNLTQRRLAKGDTNVGQFVEAALDGAQRAANLTSRLMAFSRQQPLQPQTVNINALVGGMEDLIQRAIGAGIQVETVRGAGIWTTQADPSQLESAIINLAINARDAMGDTGKLTIETANCHLDDAYARTHGIAAGQYILLAVSDTGTGMPPEVTAKAFDPFFTTKSVGKGTGLGLSQVHGFVKQSDGHVKIYSEEGHGTTVKIYLPRRYETQTAKAATKEEPVVVQAAEHNAGHVVLVVEDEPEVRKLSVSSLRELGYTVVHADGAKTALEVLLTHPEIAVLFTDIVMPETNGRQLADEALRRMPHLKVLYTTGFTRNAIVHSGRLDAGVNFLAKPFTLAQLSTKMREVLV